MVEIRKLLMEAVDGFEPKEEVSDPLWEEGIERPPSRSRKITPLFKD